MCGIYGIVTSSYQDGVSDHLERMANQQRHRGPDDKRWEVFKTENGQLGLGSVRLSIIDLETGLQPIVARRDGSAIVCNGQVYNYIELRDELADEDFVTKGDIEVALHLYRKKGIDFLNELNGMYGGAVYDKDNQKLLLFRDRFGIKPLYYCESGGEFLFSSEIKPLLAATEMPVRLNESQLPAWFSYRYLPGEETMFQGIKLLPPGSYMEYDLKGGSYSVKKYWEYRPKNGGSILTLDEAIDEFFALFEDAVRIRLRSDVEVGSFISGGIDSAAVASQAASSRPNLNLFTIGFGEQRYNELPLVERLLAVNGRFGSARHHTKLCGRETLEDLPGIVRSLEEPISLGTVLPTNMLCKMAGDRLKVVLTGEGADELFAGYRKFLVEAAAHAYPNSDPKMRKQLDALYPELSSYLPIRDENPARRYNQSEALFLPNELHRLLGRSIPLDLFPGNAMPNTNGCKHPVDFAIAFESVGRLPNYILLHSDKLAMRHSLETRTPFLDYRLAELASRLPLDYKIDLKAGRSKILCSEAFARHGVLDQESAFRGKQPFTSPLADWLSEPTSLPEFMQDIILGDVVRSHGVLDPELVKESVARISTKGVGPQTLVSDADRVFAVVMFSLWYDSFMN